MRSPRTWIAALALGGVALATVPAGAQSTEASGARRDAASTAARAAATYGPVAMVTVATVGLARDVRATDLVDMEVRNPRGESLGQVKDLVLDLERGRVHYAVLEFGGFLGLGEKLFAVPVSAFRYGGGARELVLDVPRERLERMPGFARDNWIDVDRRDWSEHFAQVDLAWREAAAAPVPGAEHAASAGRLGADPAGARYRAATDVIGMEVIGTNGGHVGEIEDLVVNLGSGRIHYAVFELDRPLNPDDRLLPVSLDKFGFAERSANAFLRVPRERLDQRLGFDRRAWPDLNDPRFVADVDRYVVTRVGFVPIEPGAAPQAAAGPSARPN